MEPTASAPGSDRSLRSNSLVNPIGFSPGKDNLMATSFDGSFVTWRVIESNSFLINSPGAGAFKTLDQPQPAGNGLFLAFSRVAPKK